MKRGRIQQKLRSTLCFLQRRWRLIGVVLQKRSRRASLVHQSRIPVLTEYAHAQQLALANRFLVLLPTAFLLCRMVIRIALDYEVRLLLPCISGFEFGQRRLGLF